VQTLFHCNLANCAVDAMNYSFHVLHSFDKLPTEVNIEQTDKYDY